MPVIEIAGLSKTFPTRAGQVHAVREVDLTVHEAEMVALLGPNGAGKTTTLDIVLGLSSASAGRVRVLGLSPRDAIAAGEVAALLQTGGLLRDLTVRETATLIASTYQAPRPVMDVLDRAGITHLASRRVSKCSGGEQQRLKFALSLLADPALLILDEPTAGMDVSARREFWQAMREETAGGRTVVFATHYLEEAESFADRVVMMASGRVVADGPTEEIRGRALVRRVAAIIPDVAAAVEILRGIPSVSGLTPSGDRLTLLAGDSDAVARVLLDLGARDLTISPGSLEDAFVALTQGQDAA